MQKLPTAAALAILLLTAGVAGVVSAEPNSTDYQTNASDRVAGPSDARVGVTDARPVPTDVRLVPTDRPADVSDDATFEQQLARRLAQFDLTDAQSREIVTEASRLHEAGASRLVIRSSIVMNLYEFGVEAPFLYAGEDGVDDRPTDHRRFHRFIESLDVTPEQARELHAMAHRMLADGATREEVKQAIREQLAEWEIDPPSDHVDRMVDSIADHYGLTDEQTAELERLIRGMIDDGADRTEIHEAVVRLLHSWDVDQQPPDARDDARRRAAVAAAP